MQGYNIIGLETVFLGKIIYAATSLPNISQHYVITADKMLLKIIEVLSYQSVCRCQLFIEIYQ